MILTLTPNPSLDRTLVLDELALGEVNRALSHRIDPGGKGVNVARALAANGASARAVLPLGGSTGELMRTLLERAGIDTVVAPIADETRTNTAIIDRGGRTTKVNEPGPALDESDLEALTEATLSQCGSADWLAICGSLPNGVPASWIGELIERAPCPVAVDTSGEPLLTAVAARPSLIKPNHHELAELIGRPVTTVGAALDASQQLVERGIPQVITSLGSLGAIIVTEEGWWSARAEAKARSTVGAGDSLLAGALHALSATAPPAGVIARGVAWGTAAVALPGSQVPSAADVAALTVDTEPIPLDSTLAD